MTQQQFRELFPALNRYVWLDTPACPPLAAPVAQALRATLEEWTTGDFRWRDWEAARADCRSLIGQHVGAPASGVALLTSFAEAAVTVAATLPPGRILVSADEHRDNLFPWQACDGSTHDVLSVGPAEGGTRSEQLVSALTPDTALVAISEVLSVDGARADLRMLRAATDAVGARLFVDSTQSLGVLELDFPASGIDYLGAHGYKWMLCPRGSAWLVARDDRIAELRPLMPSCYSTLEDGFFGGSLKLAPDCSRCDTSPAWLSWVGARAALEAVVSLSSADVEAHCLRLAALYRDGASVLGAEPIATESPSHIVSVLVPDAKRVAAKLAEAHVRALALDDRVRVGFHYFNVQADVEAVLAVLGAAL